jgi:hypothetical protein
MSYPLTTARLSISPLTSHGAEFFKGEWISLDSFALFKTD